MAKYTIESRANRITLKEEMLSERAAEVM
jgi:hypothetical protein